MASNCETNVMVDGQCGIITASPSQLSGNDTAHLLCNARLAYRAMNSAEEIYERIEQRRQKLGMTANALSLAAGMSRDGLRTMRRAIEEGRQTGVTSKTLEKLAPALRTSVEWLMSGEGVEDTGIAKEMPIGSSDPLEPPVLSLHQIEPGNVEAADIAAPRTFAFPRNVPVLGTAAGSIIRRVEGFALEQEVVDYVRRPPALMNRQDIYALYVSGISMYPLHTQGDLRFVDPRQRPNIGDSVIVLTRMHDDDPGQAYIKLLSRRSPSSVLLKQLNPEAMIEIPEKYIIQMHRVLTMNDLFGV